MALFYKGHRPPRTLSVGDITMRIDKSGARRAWIKIAEPKQWEPYAVYVWKQRNGVIPLGFIVHHQDENTLNDALENLALVSRAEHAKIHRENLERNRPNIIRQKEIQCLLCECIYMGKMRQRSGKNFCPPCAQKRENESKKRYSDTHRRVKKREEMRVKRFYEGEIWLIYRLIASRMISKRSIAKMFLSTHSVIVYYANKMESK